MTETEKEASASKQRRRLTFTDKALEFGLELGKCLLVGFGMGLTGALASRIVMGVGGARTADIVPLKKVG